MSKVKTDTVAGAVKAFQIANGEVSFTWPEHINLPIDSKEAEIAQRTFVDLQLARDPSWWRPHHRDNLAELALLFGQRSKLVQLLSRTGALTQNERNRPVRSPVLDALTMVQSTITQMLKPLGISPTQLENDRSSQNILEARKTIEHEAENPLSRLLARP